MAYLVCSFFFYSKANLFYLNNLNYLVVPLLIRTLGDNFIKRVIDKTN